MYQPLTNLKLKNKLTAYFEKKKVVFSIDFLHRLFFPHRLIYTLI